MEDGRAETIATAVESLFRRDEIEPQKLSGAVTDGAANIRKAIQILSSRFSVRFLSLYIVLHTVSIS